MARIEVMTELCKGCKLCIEACPKRLIEIGDKTNSSGYKHIKNVEDGCIGCKFCAITCPDAAITVYK